MLVVSVSTAVVPTTILITISALAVAAATAASVVVLGWVLLEALMLLSDIGQKILTELLRVLDLVRVGSTV